MERDYLFFLVDNEVGYACFFKRDEITEDWHKAYQVYLYQTRFPKDKFSIEELCDTLLEEATLQISDVDSEEEAEKVVLDYWCTPSTENILRAETKEEALEKLSEEHPIVSY